MVLDVVRLPLLNLILPALKGQAVHSIYYVTVQTPAKAKVDGILRSSVPTIGTVLSRNCLEGNRGIKHELDRPVTLATLVSIKESKKVGRVHKKRVV